jgi:hypothetical protein
MMTRHSGKKNVMSARLEDTVRLWADQQYKLRLELEQVEASAARVGVLSGAGNGSPPVQRIDDIRRIILALDAAIETAERQQNCPASSLGPA